MSKKTRNLLVAARFHLGRLHGVYWDHQMREKTKHPFMDGLVKTIKAIDKHMEKTNEHNNTTPPK